MTRKKCLFMFISFNIVLVSLLIRSLDANSTYISEINLINHHFVNNSNYSESSTIKSNRTINENLIALNQYILLPVNQTINYTSKSTKYPSIKSNTDFTSTVIFTSSIKFKTTPRATSTTTTTYSTTTPTTTPTTTTPKPRYNVFMSEFKLKKIFYNTTSLQNKYFQIGYEIRSNFSTIRLSREDFYVNLTINCTSDLNLEQTQVWTYFLPNFNIKNYFYESYAIIPVKKTETPLPGSQITCVAKLKSSIQNLSSSIDILIG